MARILSERECFGMVTVEAKAKINLTLDILGARPDGYHEVEMVMQSVGLSDTISLERRTEGIALRMDGTDLPADETNLAWKAARLFLDVYKIQQGVSAVVAYSDRGGFGRRLDRRGGGPDRYEPII